jgi:hypothetical protein
MSPLAASRPALARFALVVPLLCGLAARAMPPRKALTPRQQRRQETLQARKAAKKQGTGGAAREPPPPRPRLPLRHPSTCTWVPS